MNDGYQRLRYRTRPNLSKVSELTGKTWDRITFVDDAHVQLRREDFQTVCSELIGAPGRLKAMVQPHLDQPWQRRHRFRSMRQEDESAHLNTSPISQSRSSDILWERPPSLHE